MADVGQRLDRYLTKLTQLRNQSTVYNEERKTLDLSKFIPADVLQKILSEKTGNWYESSSLYEKFFNISCDRNDRYSEYESLIFRIPEVSQALQIYVDSVLAPDVDETVEKLVIDTIDDNDEDSSKARSVLEMIFRKSRFYKMLPQIVYTSLLYGDCFLEIEPTSNGLRYVILPTKDCSLVYDQKTDIEMGLLVKLSNTKMESNLKDILNRAYPDTILDLPDKMVAIVSDKTILADKKNKFKVANLEKQMTELLKDVYKDEGCSFKYLAPHRYVRFPIFYNNNYYPYGTSILDSVRSIAKQLLLTEANLALYRATRTPLRSMWTINVTGIPTDEISGLLRSTKDMVRRQKVLSSENGGLTIDSIPEILGEQDDLWTTKYNDQQLLEYQNLDVPDLTPYTNDAEYFRKKLLSGLGIPPSYLGEESGGSTRALLTLEDINFSRKIKRLQSDFNDSLQELADLCFTLIDKSTFVNKVMVTLPPMVSVEVM